MEKRYNIFLIVAISTLMILVDVVTFTNHTIAAINSATGDSLETPHSLTQGSIISPEKAVGLAINNLQKTEDGYKLSHPRHIMTFSMDGVSFKPLRGGPDWQWRLEHIGAESTSLSYINKKTVMPQSIEPGVVSYKRGGIVEQYLAKADTVEQQFVITEQLPLKGRDLVIEGTVKSSGALETVDNGWLWNDKNGMVSLGDVRVFDADYNELPATMNVTSSGTRIVVDGAALAKAVYPVIIDPEIGTNDFRISDMGAFNGDTNFRALSPSVTYNPINNEYFVVWEADDDTLPLVDDETEIYGQRIDATTGLELGTNDIRISDMGPDGNSDFDAGSPAVAYNSTNNEYLVVWHGDDDTDPLVGDEIEIFGQRINAADGTEIGTNDFRISDMGVAQDNNFFGLVPDVTYNSTNNEYLVVWNGTEITDTLGSENEIYGQRINAATGAEIGTNDFRISDMGPDDDFRFNTFNPKVTFNSTNNEYLVVWEGDDDTAPLVDDESEIFGQRINAADGTEIGANDFRISDMGPDGNTNFQAFSPSVTYNSINNEYLVVWRGDDDTAPLVDDENEIFGQRINAADATEIGANDFRISDMGTDGDTSILAFSPSVTFNPLNNEYFVVWGSYISGTIGFSEDEIFGQRIKVIDGKETEIDTNDMRLSDMGPDGDLSFDAQSAAVTFNSASNEYFVVWHGGDIAPLDVEIYGQLFSVNPGPSIDTITADDPDDGDIIYTDGDTITVVFSEATNQPPVSTNVEINALFTFSDSLGMDYTGVWSDASTMVITIVDSTGATPPAVDVFTLTVKESGNLKNAAGTSFSSTATSSALVGDFGALEAPSILSVTADDPDDGDGIYSDGDTITVLFAGATNQPPVSTKVEIDNIFQFSQVLGVDYIGTWTDASTLVIIIVDSKGATPPAIGGLTLTLKESGNLMNADETSLVSTATSPALTGDFGLTVVVPTPTATPTSTPSGTPTPTTTTGPTTPTPTPITTVAPTATPAPTTTAEPTPTPIPTTTVVITPTPTPVDKSALTANPESFRSTLIPQEVIVTALDQDGNPRSGVRVETTTNGRTVTVRPSSANTRADGTARFKVRFGFLATNGEAVFNTEDKSVSVTQE